MPTVTRAPGPPALLPLDFIRFLIECGGRIADADARFVHDYFRRAQERGRLIAIRERGVLKGFCVFFLLQHTWDALQYHHRAPWTFPEDDVQGAIAFVDLLVTQAWTRTLRHQIQDVMTWRYPRIREALWYRVVEDGRPDRRCHYLRKELLHGAAV